MTPIQLLSWLISKPAPAAGCIPHTCQGPRVTAPESRVWALRLPLCPPISTKQGREAELTEKAQPCSSRSQGWA